MRNNEQGTSNFECRSSLSTSIIPCSLFGIPITFAANLVQPATVQFIKFPDAKSRDQIQKHGTFTQPCLKKGVKTTDPAGHYSPYYNLILSLFLDQRC